MTIKPEPEVAAHIVNEEETVAPVTPIVPLEQCLPDKPRFDCGKYRYIYTSYAKFNDSIQCHIHHDVCCMAILKI